MRLPSIILGCVLTAPIACYGFLPRSLLPNNPSGHAIRNTDNINLNNDAITKAQRYHQQQTTSQWWSSQDHQCSMTQLNMAFNAGDRESNIFDGPLALTKERDACGVGFIANTKSGGTLLIFTDPLPCQLIVWTHQLIFFLFFQMFILLHRKIIILDLPSERQKRPWNAPFCVL